MNYIMPPRYRVSLVRESQSFDSPAMLEAEDVTAILSEYFQDKDREVFVVLALDIHLRPIGIFEAHVGTINACYVSIPDVFKPAILMNCSCVIVSHNHPSGDPTPSPEDFRITERLSIAGQHLDIEIVDHIIIGEEKHYSFAISAPEYLKPCKSRG